MPTYVHLSVARDSLRSGGRRRCPVERPYRVRRSCLAVPASSERFITKARGLPADEVFLDLEDAVVPAAKPQARANAAAAVAGDWGGRKVAVRVNDASTQWAHKDVIEVVSAAARVDVIVLPKVTRSEEHTPELQSRQYLVCRLLL